MKKITFLLLALFLQTAISWAMPAKSSLGPYKVAQMTAEMPKSISELLFSAVVQNDAILTSAPGTDAQVVCQGNSITTISYLTFGATGMDTPVGLPEGVTAVFTPMTGTYNSIGFINITGTPSVLGTFNYSIPLTGGTGVAVFATGSITINRTPAAVTSLSSNAPLCEGGQLNLLAQGAIFSGSYSMLDNSGDAFIDIAETGTNVPGSLEDDSKHTIEIPTFNYYGQNYNSATVSANGIIIFGNVATGDYFTNRSLPSAFYASGYTYVAPYWDDLLPGQTSSIKTQTVGDNFIIQYTVLGFFDSNSQPITFQVQLNLVTGAIVFVYSNVETGNAATTKGQSATVGIQNNTTTAVQYSYNTASLSNGKSIRFTPVLPDTYAWAGPNGFSSNLLNPTIPNATAAASGNYQFQVISSQGCASAVSTLPVTVTPSSLLLTSGSETTNQTVSYGSAITPIVYTTNGTITVEGLPPGLSAVSTNNSLVIAGTPTGNGSYQYTLTGSTACNNIATGTFNLVPLLLNSALSTVDQTVCQGTIITPIVYSGNVSQAVVNGLPDGVTASIDGNTITFSGAPATAGNYTYAIALDGVINEGMIAVKSLPATPTITSSGATTICEGSSVTLSASVVAVVEPIDNLSGALLATGLHKIVSSYTGPALRLRRDGDNAEQDFGFVGNDLDVNAINEWLNGTNGYCTTLYDQTGHNGNITQNDMGSQPQFVASGLNNRPILHFNTGHYMFNEVAYPTNFSVVYGAKITGTSSRVLSARHNNWLLGYWGGQMDLAYFDGWIGGGNTGVPSNNAFNIYAGTGNGMVSTIYKNGTQLFSGSEGLTAPNGIQINQHQDNGERSDVDFTDIMIYDTELSGQDVGKVNNFIAGYYGGVLSQSTNNFTWSTNENTTQIEVSTAGEYSVRTLGGNGCLSAPSAVTSVSVIAAPTVIAPENQTYCDGTVTAAIALVGTPSDVTFSIQNGAAIGLNDVTGVTAIPSFTAIGGTATVYITPFGNGCTGIPVPFTITVNKTLFNLTASADVVCLDAPVTISADFTILNNTSIPEPYCVNAHWDTNNSYITNVTFGSINNNTENDRDTWGTIHPVTASTTTVVIPGETYVLTVATGSPYEANVVAWIDYNRNGFFDASEYTPVIQNAFDGTVSITIPMDASHGTTGMRICSNYIDRDFESTDGCTWYYNGTTHDYTITIGQDVSDNTISWSSNPADASLSNVNAASFTTNPAVTTTYIATVTSATTGCSTTNAITVIAQNGVIINEQPVAETTVCEGANASFGVEATGAGLTYQWYKDGQPLTDGSFVYGAQTNVLSLGQLPLNYNGVYTVKVDSQCGEFVVSEGAVLYINPFPIVEPIANQTYCSGTVTAAIPLTNIARNFQNALRFDGSNDYVSCPNDVVPVTGEFTVSVWAKQFANNGPLSEIFAQGRCLYLGPGADGKIRLGDCWATEVAFPTDGAWHQYTIVNSLNDAFLYIDGNLVATKGSPYSYLGADIFGNPHNLLIGSQWNAGTELFNGAIDEFSVWNYARSSNEIQSDMNSELTGTETGLVAYYNFNQGMANGSNETETILFNRTANADLNGTLINIDLTGDTSNWISGQSQVGSVPGLTFAISGGEAIGLADAMGVTAIPAFTAVAGTATITVTPLANGCTGFPVTYAVTVNKTPTVAVTSDASIVCPDTPVTISTDVVSNTIPGPYCTVINENADIDEGNSTYYQLITYVGFGSIDNDTSNDLSSSNIIHPSTGNTTTVVQPGEIYPLNVSTFSNNPADVGAWIDYNRNGIYEASEYTEVFQDAFYGTVNITIPYDASTGKTGMRVRSEYYPQSLNEDDSCQFLYYGTTHDYIITIGEDVPAYYISWSSDPIDESLSNVDTASITTNLAETTTYTATVTSLAGCSATSNVTINVQNGVIINEQPVAETTVCEGAYASFSVEATGAGLTYQWFKDGQPLTDGGNLFGSTAATLTIPVSSLNDNGVYTVTVHPQCGEDEISEGATLIVNPTPTVEPIASQTYCSDTLTSAIPLLGTPDNVSYNISGGEAIGLAEALGVDSIPAFTAVAGTATITVTPIANGCVGQPTTFTITVNPRPTVALTSSATTATCPGSSVSISADIAYTEPAASYCNSRNRYTFIFPITNINFGAINSDTSNDLSNFPNTHQETTVVQPGETYTLSVNVNSFDNYYMPYVGAWIDFNKNGIYESSEYTEVILNATSASVSITIPTDAATGKTGMRIRSDWGELHGVYDNSFYACDNFTYGTTQDYTITIGEELPAYTIAWSSDPVDESLSNVNTASISPSPLVTTTYTATVTPASGCATTSSMVVEVLPAIAIAEHPVSTYVCSAVGSTASFSVMANTAAVSYTWQYRVVTTTNPNPSWITITSANAGAVYSSFTTGNLVVTKTATLPAAGTQYRALASDSCNLSANSNVAMLTIMSTVKAGTISAPASVCLGSDVTFTAGGYTGTSFQWQSAASATASFSDIQGATSASYTIYGATANMNKSYRVVVINTCNNISATSAIKTITVNPTTIAGSITGAGTICSGGGATLKLVSNVGTTIQWMYSSDGVSYSNVPTTTLGSSTAFATTSTTGIATTYIVTNVTQSTWFKATVKSGLCNTEETDPVKVIIGEPVAGKLSLTAGFSNTICSGTATSLTLNDYIGTIVWQKSADYYSTTIPTWTTVTGTTATVSTGALTNTTTGSTVVVFRANVTLGTCGTVSSIVFPINILPAAKGGTVAVNNTSGLTICSGGSKELKVTGYLGSIQWQKSTTSATATDFTDVNGAITTPYTFDNITQNTWFRVVAKNGDCLPTVLSNTIAVTLSTPVTAGTITAAANDLCPINTGTTLTLSGHVGTISWTKSTDNGNTWTTVTGTAATLSTGALAVTTAFRAKLTSGSCFDYSTIVVTVKSSTTATVIASSSIICTGFNTVLTLANFSSGTIQWQKATSLTGTYTNVTTGTGMTSATYVTPVLTATAYFRAVVTDNGCTSVTSGYKVMVNPLAKATAITGTVTATSAAAAICTTDLQTLTMASGSIGNIQWQWSPSSTASGVWNDIPNENSTTLNAQSYVPIISNIITPTYFRVKMSNSCSSAVYSAVYSVYYKNCVVFKEVVTKEKFNVIAYPNPYNEYFNLNLTTSSVEIISVSVYDMIGKLIEKHEVSPSEVSSLQVGDRYPSGVYNVVVTQGEAVKTLRVVKR